MAYESMRQGDLTQQSNDITRASIEAGSRAWVVIEGIKPIDLEANSPTVITFKNAGGSPALVKKYRLQRGFRPGRLTGLPELLPDAPNVQSEASVAVIGPGLSKTLGGDEELLGTTTKSLLREGKGTLYLWGFVEYGDPFGSDKRTDFCMYWEPHGWTDCPWGNNFK